MLLVLSKFKFFFNKIFALFVSTYIFRCETIQAVCTDTTCANDGVCYINGSANASRTYCLCSESYTGEYCETSLIPSTSCLRKPCGNGGTCIQTSSTSYDCICSNGLTGQSCNTSKFSYMNL